MDDLLLVEEKIDQEVKSLDTCDYNSDTFAEILSRIQKLVDDLNLRSYSNLPQWVAKLDEEVCPHLQDNERVSGFTFFYANCTGFAVVSMVYLQLKCYDVKHLVYL